MNHEENTSSKIAELQGDLETLIAKHEESEQNLKTAQARVAELEGQLQESNLKTAAAREDGEKLLSDSRKIAEFLVANDLTSPGSDPEQIASGMAGSHADTLEIVRKLAVLASSRSTAAVQMGVADGTIVDSGEEADPILKSLGLG